MSISATVDRMVHPDLDDPRARRRPRGESFGSVAALTYRKAAMDARASLTELMAAAAAGDEGAWSRIVDRFGALLWGVARGYRLENHLAADVVQATWLRLVENLDRIEQPEALPGWLLTTCRREALRVLRAQGRELPADDDSRPEPVSDAAELDLHLLADERDAALWRCFRALEERCQRLLRILMAPDCPPYAVVAAELGVPIGSLGPTRGRCLAKLKELLAASDYDFSTVLEGGTR